MMLKVLVLMSGPSTAFSDAGYQYPKNLVEIGGVSLAQLVLERLSGFRDLGAHLICVLRREENSKHHTGAVIQLMAPGAIVVEVGSETSGAACSALLAIEHINDDTPLLVVNGDQVIDADLVGIVREFQSRALDGGIVVFEAFHPRWSFVKCGDGGLVIEAAEKRPISNMATAGCYYFAKGSDCVLAAEEMMRKDAHVNGLFYICPAYNELVLRQRRIGTHKIPRQAYHSLATPADVERFQREGASR